MPSSGRGNTRSSSASPTRPTPAFGLLTTWAYVERFVFPWPQTFFDRPLLAGLDGSLVPLKFLVLGVLTVLGMLALSVRAWRRDRPAFWLLVATVALLGPLLNFTDAGVGVTTSDRFLYLPLLSFSVAVFRLWRPLAIRWSQQRPALLTGLGVLAIWIAIVEVRMLDYLDDETFWLHEMKLDDRNPFVLGHMRSLYARRGAIEEAYEISKRTMSPEGARYVNLTTPPARAQRYLYALALHAALTADGDAKTLAQINSEQDAFVRGQLDRMTGRVDDVRLDRKLTRSLTEAPGRGRPVLASRRRRDGCDSAGPRRSSARGAGSATG